MEDICSWAWLTCGSLRLISAGTELKNSRFTKITREALYGHIIPTQFRCCWDETFSCGDMHNFPIPHMDPKRVCTEKFISRLFGNCFLPCAHNSSIQHTTEPTTESEDDGKDQSAAEYNAACLPASLASRLQCLCIMCLHACEKSR